MITSKLLTGGRRIILLPKTVLTDPVTDEVTDEMLQLAGAFYLIAQIKFVYGSGGTNLKCFVQTSVDGGESWIDIICLAVTTTSRVVPFGEVTDNNTCFPA